ncbi:MAG TPA: hypothetical protein VFP98_06505 [Candidatus Polarisedimenticolia bacterium]|nr:hypothetical protein [Candidatus Polarisedimenticolia bacterium]
MPFTMELPRDPKTPLLVRVISILVALAIGGTIVYLVFTFGYYASGMATLKEYEKIRSETPIDTQFTTPAPQPAPADPNG